MKVKNRAPGGPDGASLGPRARGARPGEGAESERGMPCSQGSKPPAPFDSLSAVGTSSDQHGSSGPVGEGGGCPARLRSLWEPLKLGVTPRSVQLARSITAARWAPAECVRTGKSPWDGSEQRAGLVLFALSVGPGSRRPSLPSAPQARRAARLHKGLDPLPSHPAPPDRRKATLRVYPRIARILPLDEHDALGHLVHLVVQGACRGSVRSHRGLPPLQSPPPPNPAATPSLPLGATS